MSRAARCFGSSLRSTASSHSSPSLAAARVLIPGIRTYGQAAVQRRQRQDALHVTKPRRSRETKVAGTGSGFDSRPAGKDFKASKTPRMEAAGGDATESQVPTHFAEYMNQLFSPLQFPPELAQRILTHASHHLARRGHNAAYSFIGRRVLNAYFLMFLNSSRHLTPQHDIEQIASSALHTNLLGEHVAHSWGIGRVLVWAPSAPSEFAANKLDLQTLRSAGLYKVQGEAVQAMVGGIYQQYGGSVAHRLFHTRILPRLRVKGGLPYPFFGDAQRFCDAMGGEQGSLLLEDSKRPKVEA